MKDAENWPMLSEMSNNNSGSSANVRSTPSNEPGTGDLNRDATSSPCNSEESSISEDGSLKEPVDNVSFGSQKDINDSHQISADVDPIINETKENVNPSNISATSSTASVNKRTKKPKSKNYQRYFFP